MKLSQRQIAAIKAAFRGKDLTTNDRVLLEILNTQHEVHITEKKPKA